MLEDNIPELTEDEREAIKSWREYKELRKSMGLPDFTTSNPDYFPGQEFEYSLEQTRKLLEEHQ